VKSCTPAFRLPPGISIFWLAGVENIRNREVVGAQSLRIHNDVDLAIGSALDLDLADSLAVFKPSLDQFIGYQCHIAGRAVGGNGDLQNGSGIGIHFRYDRDLALEGNSLTIWLILFCTS